MKKLSITILVACLALVSESLLAQGGGREGGSASMGRGRTTWLTDAELASEALKEFEAGLERMTLDEWKDNSVAWLAIEVDGDARRISLPETFHVSDVSADKRAEVERAGAEWEPAFQIAFPKKPPRELELTLTDLNSTKVSCPLADAVKKERGMLGVFIHDSAVRCVFREAKDGDEEAA